MCALRDGRLFTWGCGRALGLGAEALTEVAQPASWASAGNYEWEPGDLDRCWQASSPSPLEDFSEFY